MAVAVNPAAAVPRAVTTAHQAVTAAPEEVNRGIQTILAEVPGVVVQTIHQAAPGVVVLMIRLQVLEAAVRMTRWKFVEDMEQMIRSGMSVVTTIQSDMSEGMTTRQAM